MNSNTGIIRLVLLLVILVFICGCSSTEAIDNKPVKDTVEEKSRIDERNLNIDSKDDESVKNQENEEESVAGTVEESYQVLEIEPLQVSYVIDKKVVEESEIYSDYYRGLEAFNQPYYRGFGIDKQVKEVILTSVEDNKALGVNVEYSALKKIVYGLEKNEQLILKDADIDVSSMGDEMKLYGTVELGPASFGAFYKIMEDEKAVTYYSRYLVEAEMPLSIQRAAV